MRMKEALAAGAALMLAPMGTFLATQADAQPAKARDLADLVAGRWHGAVTSDVRGSSREGVIVTVRKVGRNLVEVSCDYPRIPTVRVALESAGSSILSATRGVTFLVERHRDPSRLDLYIDQAALIVRR